MEPSQEQRDLVRRYIALDTEELYSLIPAYLPEYDNYLFSPEGQRSAGKEYFDKLRNKLKKSVCKDFDWPSKRDNPQFDDTVNLAATIADVIAAHVTGVPPILISVLLVKFGLDN